MRRQEVSTPVLRRRPANPCTCRTDYAFLRSRRPPYEDLPSPVRVVDLFAGLGALSVGVAEAARHIGRGTDIRLAIDSDPDAAAVFISNFPRATVEVGRVEDRFDGSLGGRFTRSELAIARRVGHVDVLVGGPPCQGHSNLNNY